MRDTLSVLHVYSGNLFGGVERMLISLAALDPARNRSHFALCFEGRLSHALQSSGAPVTFLGPVRLRNPLSVVRARRELRRLLSSRRFDAVVCHSVWAYSIFAAVARRAGHAPILYLHDIPNPKHSLYRWAWLVPPALCIANSEATAHPLSLMRSQPPIRIVHPLVWPLPPLDTLAVGQLRVQLGANRDDVVILQASRFESLKGHRNLLEALSAMREVPSWRCWIAGSPQRPEEESYERELRGLTSALGLEERVHFIGHRDDMDAILAACDVYCQPNETPEAFGMVFVEAMYAGKPVVGRALGGAVEIVTPECGVLCAPGPGPLAAALQRLIVDRRLRARMGELGPARAAALSGPEAFEVEFQAAVGSVARVMP